MTESPSATLQDAYRHATQQPQRLRWMEFFAVFLGVPVAIEWQILPNLPIPILLVSAAFVYLMLRRDAQFDQRLLWSPHQARVHLPAMLLRFLILGVLLTGAVWLFFPEKLFIFPRSRPAIWLMVMVLYPVLSVYPQEVIFRAFFFHRYASLFRTPRAMVIASGLAFGFAHIVFGAWISVALSTAGGILFARSYVRSSSLFLSVIEHALYGCLVFTIGLGQFFYHGAR